MFDYQYRLSLKKDDTDAAFKVHNTFPIHINQYSGITPEEVQKVARNIEENLPQDWAEKAYYLDPAPIWLGKASNGNFYTNFQSKALGGIAGSNPERLGKSLFESFVRNFLTNPEKFNNRSRHLLPLKKIILQHSGHPSHADVFSSYLKSRRSSIHDNFDFLDEPYKYILRTINKNLPGAPMFISLNKFEEDPQHIDPGYLRDWQVVGAVRQLLTHFENEFRKAYPAYGGQ